MGELISDEVLETFAVVAEPDDVAARLVARYGGLVDRLHFSPPQGSDPDATRAMVASLKNARA
jgi:alkanesulfonate monooxygenase SsuD/methylene tetrahydromethanopterin reductase-like flavin-dependent oxidoreductase (luciferase family)